jgi:hypothetical protein
MNIALKRFMSSTVSLATNQAPTRGDLVVIPQPPPTLAELAAEINADYANLQAAALTAVEKAINIGKRLNEAKAQTRGKFTGYVTSNHPFTIRWAQKCMTLANHEAEVRQRLEELRTASSHLSLAAAFKFLGSLNPRPKVRHKKAN